MDERVFKIRTVPRRETCTERWPLSTAPTSFCSNSLRWLGESLLLLILRLGLLEVHGLHRELAAAFGAAEELHYLTLDAVDKAVLQWGTDVARRPRPMAGMGFFTYFLRRIPAAPDPGQEALSSARRGSCDN